MEDTLVDIGQQQKCSNLVFIGQLSSKMLVTSQLSAATILAPLQFEQKGKNTSYRTLFETRPRSFHLLEPIICFSNNGCARERKRIDLQECGQAAADSLIAVVESRIAISMEFIAATKVGVSRGGSDSTGALR
ncbi:hypothetical protein PIB30_098758, partial [Stylosanthes scabra]|nr:hypothetical protein [Stylosanthes scabra]